jgi:hypothetical protein
LGVVSPGKNLVVRGVRAADQRLSSWSDATAAPTFPILDLYGDIILARHENAPDWPEYLRLFILVSA